MNTNTKILFFYAYWDNNAELYDEIFALCKKNGIFFDGIDCEEKAGVMASTKYGVKLCPYIIAIMDGKEVWRGIANDFHKEIIDLMK